MNDATRAAVAERGARAGAAVAADAFRTDLDVETKRFKTDFVTEADRRAQRRVVEIVERAASGEPIVGEEAGTQSTLPTDGVAWLVDPIDGTGNYVHGSPLWTTSVAVVRDERPLASANVMPAFDDVYVAGPDGLTLNGEPATVSNSTDPEAFAVAPMMG